ncbi:SDR family oxidoreductase [Streptomyces sp. NPDC046985]|uniref:SDR family oxidoreductase n=1 Tax=Streptomyces sp. NPDC046985 TaxID=3155377 RepID=UPI003408C0E3
MIIVTGATGQLGARTVDRLLTRVPAARIGVSVRDPRKASHLADRGVRVRQGDFGSPETLAHAFEGAEQVLVVSAMTIGPEARVMHAAAIDAARDAGARRVLYTSHQGVSDTSRFAPMPDHAAAERRLAASGTAHTSLRNGFYASTVPGLVASALRTGKLVAPHDGPVSWTAHDDLAEAAAVILAEEGRFDGPTPPLTGPQALDLDDVAALLTKLTGRTVERVTVPEEEYVAALREDGVPEAVAQLTLGMFRAFGDGDFDTVTDDLSTLIGRPATPLRTLLETVVAAQ